MKKKKKGEPKKDLKSGLIQTLADTATLNGKRKGGDGR